MKTFCIAGPIQPEDNYFIPKRLDWSRLDALVDQKSYFLLHAPRQSGKTTVILEYANYLNAQGKYAALYLTTEPAPDDIQYVRDLGLVKLDSWEIANPIYQQIIPRVLTQVLMELIKVDRSWHIENSGKLNMVRMLEGFTDFFRENAEGYQSRTPYNESYPHLLLMAYLQRIINGGGLVHREYGLGKKRVDILVEWKKKERYIIEIKIKRGEETLKKGLKQTGEYLDLCKGTEAHLIIVDRNSKKSWEERISNEEIVSEGKKIHLWTL